MVERYRPTTAALEPREPNRYRKGQPRPEGAGRKPGSLNKITALVKDNIVSGIGKAGMLEPIYRRNRDGQFTEEVIGWRPTGKGGVEGFIIWLACHHPRSAATLLGRVLPYQLNVSGEANVTVTTKFKGVSLKNLPLEQKMAMMQEALGLTKPLAPPVKTIEGRVLEDTPEESMSD